MRIISFGKTVISSSEVNESQRMKQVLQISIVLHTWSEKGNKELKDLKKHEKQYHVQIEIVRYSSYTI